MKPLMELIPWETSKLKNLGVEGPTEPHAGMIPNGELMSFRSILKGAAAR